MIFILILVLNGTPAPAPVTFTTEAACHAAGEAWVKESAKLRGMSKGDFACVPAAKE